MVTEVPLRIVSVEVPFSQSRSTVGYGVKHILFVDAFFAGDIAKAAKMQCDFMPMVRSLFCESNPIPVKAAMAALGFCENYLRLPLVPMEDAHEAMLRQKMRDLGLKV